MLLTIVPTALNRRAFIRIIRTLPMTAAALMLAGPLAAQAIQQGPSGLPLPRFVSLKSDKVNVRTGPGTDHRVEWTFRKAALPVEVIEEFGNWRQVRDADGEEGWIYHSLLSGDRTALVSPWTTGEPLPLRAAPYHDARVAARLAPKVLANIKSCDGSWCSVEGPGWSGYLPQEELWGVYPDEIVD